jgi:hypothetical protein
MICSNCHKTSIAEAIDVGKLFNLTRGLAFVCSRVCKKELTRSVKHKTWMLKKLPQAS